MKVLITGKGGQLAWELEKAAPANIELTSLCIDELDITEPAAVEKAVRDFCPDVVINAAAYTAVDKAESEADTAYAVNRDGVSNLVDACNKLKTRLIHVSTDFVFDGNRSLPYQTDSSPNPVSVYGASKLAGDKVVEEKMPGNSVIVRTAWVYSANANNFVKTMLRLMGDRDELSVVCDQIGSPTWAKGLADWIWAVTLEPNVSGTYHWTDAGVASWYDFAVAIQELALDKGLLKKRMLIKPIPTEAYPTPAKRPAYSVLDKSSAELVAQIQTIHWREQLSSMLDELTHEIEN